MVDHMNVLAFVLEHSPVGLFVHFHVLHHCMQVATVALYLYVLPPSLHTPTTGSSWTTVTTLADVWHSDDKVCLYSRFLYLALLDLCLCNYYAAELINGEVNDSCSRSTHYHPHVSYPSHTTTSHTTAA